MGKKIKFGPPPPGPLGAIFRCFLGVFLKILEGSQLELWNFTAGLFSEKRGDINPQKNLETPSGPLGGVFRFFIFFLKISKFVIGFRNFRYDFWWVWGDVWRWLCRHVRRKISVCVDGGTSGPSIVLRRGARTPIGASGICFVCFYYGPMSTPCMVLFVKLRSIFLLAGLGFKISGLLWLDDLVIDRVGRKMLFILRLGRVYAKFALN
jgi:hypothetical protein